MNEIFEVFGVDLRMLLIQVVNFSILLTVLWYVLYKPLLSFIDTRRRQIIEGVAKAERAEAMLSDADAQKAAIITKASLEAQTIVHAARESGQAKEAMMAKLAQEKADRIIAEAKAQAEEEKRRALEQSKEEVAKMIVHGVEKMLQNQRTT